MPYWACPLIIMTTKQQHHSELLLLIFKIPAGEILEIVETLSEQAYLVKVKKNWNDNRASIDLYKTFVICLKSMWWIIMIYASILRRSEQKFNLISTIRNM